MVTDPAEAVAEHDGHRRHLPGRRPARTGTDAVGRTAEHRPASTSAQPPTGSAPRLDFEHSRTSGPGMERGMTVDNVGRERGLRARRPDHSGPRGRWRRGHRHRRGRGARRYDIDGQDGQRPARTTTNTAAPASSSSDNSIGSGSAASVRGAVRRRRPSRAGRDRDDRTGPVAGRPGHPAVAAVEHHRPARRARPGHAGRRPPTSWTPSWPPSTRRAAGSAPTPNCRQLNAGRTGDGQPDCSPN